MSVASDAFYDKFRYKRYDFENAFLMYRKLGEKIRQETVSIEDNLYLPSIETYRTVPLRFVNIKDAQYDINGIYADLSKQKSEALNNRLSGKNAHDTLSNDEIVSWLDKMGYYIQFSAQREEQMTEDYAIESFELYDNFGKLLTPGVDYVFDNNKLYLLGEYASDLKYTASAFVLKNIAVNLQTFEKSVANNLNIMKTDKVPKSIFTKHVKTLTKYALKASQIQALQNSAKDVFEQSVVIGDMYTDDEDIINIFKTNKQLTPYDFIVYAAESIDQSLVSIYNQYLKKTKFCETNFYTILHGNFEDSITYEEEFISQLAEILTEDYESKESKGELILTNKEIAENTTFSVDNKNHRVTFHTGAISSSEGIREDLQDVYNFKDSGGLEITDNAQYKALEATYNKERRNIDC